MRQEMMGFWVALVSAPRSRQITTSTPHHSIFYRPDALPDVQPTVSKQNISLNITIRIKI